jgi:hypothetical protein
VLTSGVKVEIFVSASKSVVLDGDATNSFDSLEFLKESERLARERNSKILKLRMKKF